MNLKDKVNKIKKEQKKKGIKSDVRIKSRFVLFKDISPSWYYFLSFYFLITFIALVICFVLFLIYIIPNLDFIKDAINLGLDELRELI